MPRISIDGQAIDVTEGTTILDAARAAGLSIPTLCHDQAVEAWGACMVCQVRVEGRPNFIPACATIAEEGMVVVSESDDVRAARRLALDLLLSEHLGDCLAPCHRICPAGMDIPRMIRAIGRNAWEEAIAIVKQDIPIPASLGRICPAPCEKGCRRGQFDQPVAICLLKRAAADRDLAAPVPWVPHLPRPSGKTVAIVGGGPAGLSAAWFLRMDGVVCTIFEALPALGGQLRQGVDAVLLPRDVLDAEIAAILKAGATVRTNVVVGRIDTIDALCAEYDAVLIAAGEKSVTTLLGNDATVDRTTCETSRRGVFAAGSAVHATRMAVVAVGSARTAAHAITAFLEGRPIGPRRRPFTTLSRGLKPDDIRQMAALAGSKPRQQPSCPDGGLSDGEAGDECARCLHCDCRKVDTCRLRTTAIMLGASPARFAGEHREYACDASHPLIIYESGKCILCGLCVRLAHARGLRAGPALTGRGYSTTMRAPFDQPLSEALPADATEFVAICPTGALSLKKDKIPMASRKLS